MIIIDIACLKYKKSGADQASKLNPKRLNNNLKKDDRKKTTKIVIEFK